MNIEFGKYYKLNPDKYYFCTNIQTRVKFQEVPLVIKLTHTHQGEAAYGNIIHHQYIIGDEETNIEIELAGSKDIIEEYEFNQLPIGNGLIFYMDFPYLT